MKENANLKHMNAHWIVILVWILLCLLVNGTEEGRHFLYDSAERRDGVIFMSIIHYAILFGLPLVAISILPFRNTAVSISEDRKSVYGVLPAIGVLAWGGLMYLLARGDEGEIIDIYDHKVLKVLNGFFTIPLAVVASAIYYRYQANDNRNSKLTAIVLMVVLALWGLLFYAIGGIRPDRPNDLDWRLFRLSALYFTPILMLMAGIGLSHGNGKVVLRNPKGGTSKWKIYITTILCLWLVALMYFTSNPIKWGVGIYSTQQNLWEAVPIVVTMLTLIIPLLIVCMALSPNTGTQKAEVEDEKDDATDALKEYSAPSIVSTIQDNPVDEPVSSKRSIKKKHVFLCAFVVVLAIGGGWILANINKPTSYATEENESELEIISADEFQPDDAEPTVMDNKAFYRNIANAAKERLLTEDDFLGCSKHDLKVIRNWIFATHGYIFKTQEMKEFFEGEAWYKPLHEDVSSMLSETEKRNVAFIKQHE